MFHSIIYNYDGTKLTKAYIFIPENLFTIEYNSLNINNLFTFKILLSNSVYNRYYLMSNKSLNGRSPNSIELSSADTRVINKFYYEDNNWIKIEDEFNSSINNSVYGFINLCINDNDNNTYTEGLELSLFENILSNGGYLLNSELASVYYGYIFKPSTLIYDLIQKIAPKQLLFANCAQMLSISNDNQIIQRLSPHVKLPSILHYITFDDQAFPQKISSGTKYSDVINRLFKSYPMKFNTNGNNINIGQIDITCIDKFTISCQESTINYVNTNEETIEYKQYKFTAIYNTFEYTKTYISDLSLTQEHFENMFNNDYRDELTKLIYYNYLLLFNEWNKSSAPNEQKKASLNPYYTLNLIDSGNYYNVINFDNEKLYRSYTITCNYNDSNSTYYVVDITGNQIY